MIYLFLNSPSLGGAERSAILQAASAFHSQNLVFCLPRIGHHKNESIEKFIMEQIPVPQIKYFDFDQNLYSVSRSGKFLLIFKVLSLLKNIFSMRSFLKKINLSKDDSCWMNGNKIAILLFFTSLIYQIESKMIWHFRDYPENSIFFKLVKVLFFRNVRENFLALANSQSVEQTLKMFFPTGTKTAYVYNPSGEFKFIPNRKFQNIGLASMLAPWKGQHDVLLSVAIFKDDLKNLGIKKILIFGDQIYLTSGAHDHYKEDLIRLIDRLDLNDFVELKGNQNPRDIMNQIDILIHSSLRPEPFGRILVEAMSSGVAICSTGLGGASEIVGDDERGWTYFPNHPRSLFNAIREIVKTDQREQKILCAREWVSHCNDEIPIKLKCLFT
ncbi:MAG: hypothetical protein OHK0056_13470 [Bacteriovoracaceae bacterium]